MIYHKDEHLMSSFLLMILPYFRLLIVRKLMQPSNASFSNKIESVQYNAVLSITEAIKGSSPDKL